MIEKEIKSWLKKEGEGGGGEREKRHWNPDWFVKSQKKWQQKKKIGKTAR